MRSGNNGLSRGFTLNHALRGGGTAVVYCTWTLLLRTYSKHLTFESLTVLLNRVVGCILSFRISQPITLFTSH